MFWITFIFLVVTSKVSCEPQALRILYGRDAEEGEFSYVVALFSMNSNEDRILAPRQCTGSVIAKDWVLTAAHCLLFAKLENLYVLHTNFTVSPLISKQYAKAIKFFIHPGFSTYAFNNDIGLLQVEKLEMNSYGQLLAVDHLTMIGLPVTYVGAGSTRETKGGDDALRPLQVGEAGITTCPSEVVENYYRVRQKYIICLAATTDNIFQIPFYGDSGGPLLFEDRIVGVCSIGSGKSFLNGDSYAAVSPHLTWIYNVLHNKY